MNISIIGCGAYSLAMAKRLSKNKNNKIIIWSENIDNVNEFKKNQKINSIYKDEIFNKNISITNNYNECLKNSDVIFMMTSMKFLKITLENIKYYYKKNIPIIIGTKGIDTQTNKFSSYIVKKVLKTNNYAIIAGPSFAIDILNDELFALTVASPKKKIFKLLTTLLNKENNSYLEFTKDILSVQLSSTIKNVYAIGAGIINGLKLPDSNNSIYLTRVLNEYNEIFYMFECSYNSIFNLSSIGDTIMTCSDSKSRNFTYGKKLCSKSPKMAENYLNKTTVEGVYSSKAIISLISKKKIKAPILFKIYEIINNEAKPEELINELINKPKKIFY